MKRIIGNLLFAVVINAIVLTTARGAQFVTTSAAGLLSLSAGGNSFGPAFSGDGRRNAFVSHAGNLVTNETLRESLQVFVRDLAASNTVLVSVSTNGSGGNANSVEPMLSSNGQFVVFVSEAGDLVSGDMNNASDVFVRDLSSGVTRLVSADILGNAPVNDQPASVEPLSGNPMISADGRWAFFESRATNLTHYTGLDAADSNGTTDVFGRDLATGSNFLVSVYWVYNRAANGRSVLADITPDATRVAFISTATDLSAPAGNPLGDVYVRDLPTRNTYRVSANISANLTNYQWLDAALSEDGRFVAAALAMNTSNASLFRIEVETGASLLVATNVLAKPRFHISADGRYIAYSGGTNVFRFDANTGTNELVNMTTTGAAPVSGTARNPVMTPDGNGIVFISNCPDLVTNTSTLFQIYARDMAAGTTRLITVATNGQPSATSSEVSLFAVTPDFSRVAFDAMAADLVHGDGNRASDVFIRDLPTEISGLVSIRNGQQPRGSGLGHAVVGPDCVSADARFIAFTSYDTDLLPDDGNLRPDVFIRDLTTAATVTPGFSTNAARAPAISANGRYLVYLRRSPIYPFDTSGGTVLRFDRETGTNEFVADVSGLSVNPSTITPVISSNGNLVAFLSNGSLIVRDMTQAMDRVIGPALKLWNGSVYRDALFTPDGRFMLFNALNTQLGFYTIHAWDTVLQQTQNVGIPSIRSLAVSGDSRFLAFATASEIYITDLIARTNQLLRSGLTGQSSVALNGDGTLIVFAPYFATQLQCLNRTTGEETSVAGAGDYVSGPAISADGRFVVYARRLRLDGGATLTWNLHVRDRKLGTTTLITHGSSGSNANAQVSRVILAADGRTVVFHSVASDLVPGDYNDKSDVFVLKLGGADTDGDGMDDDWEVAYFGNLSRDGRGDFDGDGATDLQEFLAGTDPTNGDSVFRVMTVTPLGGGSTRVIWTGNPTCTYRVEYKDDLAATTWTTLDASISWDGSIASVTDPAASASRYYRVVRLP